MAVTLLFSCGEEKKRDEKSDVTDKNNNTAPLLEPPKEQMLAFADTLYGRKIINDDTLNLIRNEIEKGKIKHGAFDFLPYLKNAKIIDLDSVARNSEPEKYMMGIYNEISSLIPGFVSTVTGITHTYNPPPGAFGKLVMKEYPRPVMESEDPDTEVDGHEWCVKLKFNYEEDSTDYCFTGEREIVYLINHQLDAQRSEYRVIDVSLYADKEGKIIEEKFGVISLPKKQGENLYLLEHNNGDGGYIYPWFEMSEYYAEYLTEDSIRKVVDECKKIGLLDHLSSSVIDAKLNKILKISWTSPYEIMGSFPGAGDTLMWGATINDSSYTRALVRLSKMSKGKFNPVTIRESTVSDYEFGTDIILSYRINGRLYWDDFNSEYFYEYEFLTFVNRSLTASGADGKFYVMDEMGNIIFLNEKQVKSAEENGLFYFHEPSPPPEKD